MSTTLRQRSVFVFLVLQLVTIRRRIGFPLVWHIGVLGGLTAGSARAVGQTTLESLSQGDTVWRVALNLVFIRRVLFVTAIL